MRAPRSDLAPNHPLNLQVMHVPLQAGAVVAPKQVQPPPIICGTQGGPYERESGRGGLDGVEDEEKVDPVSGSYREGGVR